MPQYPSGTVAFLFTDIEGSTRRWESQRQAMWAAVERHFAILRETIAANDGVLFKTIGDAVQAAFPTVPQAVAAAVAAQTALRSEPWGELGPLRVRMAIHVGEATPSQGDYLAPALNRLARLLSAGHGDQVLMTEAARLLATSFPENHDVRDLGLHRLRDLQEAERVFQVIGPGLPLDFPPLKSLDQQPNNLPPQPTALFGRERELDELRDMLAAPTTRLVTLTGPGGTGKTRLAIQAAAESLDTFPDGVWWAPLAAVTDSDLVPDAIAAPLGVREVAGQPLLETLADHLAGKRTLLLLDNLEQVVAAAPFIGQLLDRAPQLVVLATSREPLRLRAEREFPVEPLPLPAGTGAVALDTALASPAVRLFIERAQSVKPGFAIDARNVVDVVAICRRLDGLPLAIELAAARIRILAPAALLARLDQRLNLLTGGARDLPQRQQTLRATIGWSYDLLAPPEQSLFARLAVFVGGSTFEAAEAICNAAGGLPLDLFDGIESLVQKSLLRQHEDPTGDVRFVMLETIREFAQERLTELLEANDLRRAHADFFQEMAESANWDDPGQQGAMLDRLEAEHANFRQAIATLEEQGAEGLGRRTVLAASLAYFWWVRGHLTEGRQLIDRALATPGAVEPLDLASARSAAALLATEQGDLERAERLYEESLPVLREGNDADGVARALSGLGAIARQRGELDVSRSRYQEALAAWRSLGDALGAAGALLDLGSIRLLEGDYEGAEPALNESLGLFHRSRDAFGEANALQRLGFLAMSTGAVDTALARFRESLERWRSLGNQQMIATDLANLGEVRHLQGSLEEAEQLYGQALSLYETLADQGGRGFVLSQLGYLELDRGNSAKARTVLLEGLRLRWSAGERGVAADTLEALAETNWHLGDAAAAAKLLRAAALLREETGVARQPVYETRYQWLLCAIGDCLPSVESIDIDDTVAALLE